MARSIWTCDCSSRLVDAVVCRIGWHLFDEVPRFEGIMASYFESIGTANK